MGNPKEKNTRARIMMVSSMATFGTLSLFVRNIELNSGELALYRAVLASLLLGVYLALGKGRQKLSDIKQELPVLFASGAAMGFNWILLFQAYNYTTVSLATLSYYFAPVIVTAVCPILFQERLTGKQLLCFVMSTAGLVLIIGGGGLSGGADNRKGILFGLGAAALYASVIILNKYIKNVTGLPRTLIQFLAAVLVLIPYVAGTGGMHLKDLDGVGLVCLLIVGLFHTGVTYCMYFSSIKDLKGQEASVLSYIDPLVAVLISVVILKEPITGVQVVGGCLILGFAVWNEIN